MGQVTGFMTISDSNKLPADVKQKILDAPDGHVRRFRKQLVDLSRLPLDEETRAKVEEVLKDAPEAVVSIDGRAYMSGTDKSGNRIDDRKQSLTCRVAFKVNGVESYFNQKKVEEADKADTLQNDMLEALI